MASPQPVYYPITHTHMLPRMPSPHGEDSLRFRGKDIDHFLSEFEYFARQANLTEEEKCAEIRLYFSKKEKPVLDILAGYINKDWPQLKRELESLYTSSARTKIYSPRDIQRFIAEKRKITKLVHFDTY